jgi:S1-C subfamily serine protease
LGIATENGVIEKAFVRLFLKSKEVVYSDIGIRLGDKDGVRVMEVNPFFADSPFLLSDIILSMDGKKAESAAQMSKKILFCAPGSKHHFLILRGDEKLKIEATLQKRLSGGLVPDSFFDLFGLELDENLIVKSDNTKYEIKKGDKLLFVMGKEVKTLADIRKVLSEEKSSKEELVLLLFKRNGFDFFIHFPK